MNWINVRDDFPNTKIPVLGFCHNENEEFEWMGFVQVYFDPQTGWHRCELYDKKPIRVLFWTKLPEKPIQKDQFYFQGKCFDNETEFFDYTRLWIELPLDQETAERELDTVKKEIVMNIFLRGIKLTNGQFRELLNKVLEFTITSVYSKT